MKKIINGKIYDTEASTLIGQYSYKEKDDLINTIFEKLYMTPRSRSFFLAGFGGVNTKYRTPSGKNTWTGGEKVCPLTKQQAFEWSCRYLDNEVVERYFNRMSIMIKR